MNALVREAKLRLGVPFGFLITMWLVEVANLVSHNFFLVFGIHPRTWAGLWGIAFAPFLHANLPHIIANTGPFLILGTLIALRGARDFVLVTCIVMVVGGGGVWLLGRPFSNHVGASGLIFGYFGFLLVHGFFERSFRAVFVSLATVALYGGMIWGVFPSMPGVSWESHLFGFLAGALAGRLLAIRPSPVVVRTRSVR